MTAALECPVGDLWARRLVQAGEDSYMGIALRKMPEDLRVYEHLLWQARPSAIIEIGAWEGASALWFRDRLRCLRDYGLIESPRVVAIDLHADLAAARLRAVDPGYEDTITLIRADVRDRRTGARVAEALPANARCMVVEDSAHTYETTSAALRSFAGFVPAGGHFVVEDGVVDMDELRQSEDWPRGVRAAIDDWLCSDQGAQFARRPELTLYGLSSNCGGYLQRREQDPGPRAG